MINITRREVLLEQQYQDYLLNESGSYFLTDEYLYTMINEMIEQDRYEIRMGLLNEEAAAGEGLMGSLSAAWGSLKGFLGSAADSALGIIKGLPDTLKGWANGLGDKFKQLGGWMQTDSGKTLTAAGLAGAGLLGTYYLWRKWKKEGNTPTARDFQIGARLDGIR